MCDFCAENATDHDRICTRYDCGLKKLTWRTHGENKKQGKNSACATLFDFI